MYKVQPIVDSFDIQTPNCMFRMNPIYPHYRSGGTNKNSVEPTGAGVSAIKPTSTSSYLTIEQQLEIILKVLTIPFDTILSYCLLKINIGRTLTEFYFLLG